MRIVKTLVDSFQELGHANGYNRGGGFTAICNGAKSVNLFPSNPTVIQR
jgi:hypothetical protein